LADTHFVAQGDAKSLNHNDGLDRIAFSNYCSFTIAEKRSTEMFFPVHPAAIEFNEIDCCALRKATTENDHQPFIRAFIREARKDNLLNNVSVLLEIFEKTVRLVFIPRTIHRSFYLYLVVMEKKLLEGSEGSVLECGHSAKQHGETLARICASMLTPQGHN